MAGRPIQNSQRIRQPTVIIIHTAPQRITAKVPQKKRHLAASALGRKCGRRLPRRRCARLAQGLAGCLQRKRRAEVKGSGWRTRCILRTSLQQCIMRTARYSPQTALVTCRQYKSQTWPKVALWTPFFRESAALRSPHKLGTKGSCY